MDPATQQNGIDWQLISNAIAQGVIPAPAGSNENGEPYWIFNEQKITWQQVQNYVVQAKQKQQAAATSGGIESGGGLESFPQMPSMPSPETRIESNVETRVESAPERAPEKKETPPQLPATQPTQTKPLASAPQKKNKGPSFVGQSAPLTTVDTSDPKSMVDFSSEHKSDPTTSSNRFLAEFLDKVLQVLSLDVK